MVKNVSDSRYLPVANGYQGTQWLGVRLSHLRREIHLALSLAPNDKRFRAQLIIGLWFNNIGCISEPLVFRFEDTYVLWEAGYQDFTGLEV